MPLLRRRPPADPGGPRVVYARVLDGETLWLAVTGATSVRLGEHDVPLDDGAARVALGPLFDGPGSLALTADGVPLPAGDGVLDEGPMRTPPSRDGRRQYAVVDPTALRVTCSERRAEVLLLAAWAEADALVVRLPVDRGSLTVGEATVEVADGRARLTADLVPDEPGASVPLTLGGRPVARPASALRFPGAAVVLPGLGAGEDFSPYLRWQRDGTLALARAERADAS